MQIWGKFLQYFWKLTALTPYYYKNGTKFSYPIFFFTLFNFLWSVPLCVYYIYDVVVRPDDGSKIHSSTALAVSVSNTLVIVFTSFTCFIASAVKYKSLAKIELKIEKLIEKLNPNVNIIDKCCFTFLVFYIILLIIDISINFEQIFIYLPTYVFHLVIVGFLLQISSTALRIHALFLTVNSKLPLSINNKPKEAFSGNANLNFDNYTDVHWSLCTIIDNVNFSYGPQLAVTFLSVFLHIITMPYNIYLLVADFNSFDFREELLATVQGLWTIIYVLELIILILPCSLAANQASYSSIVVCRNLTKTLPNAVRKQCKLFLKQLSYHEVYFSALSLFKIELTVITAIAGSVSTYLVILIQFQNNVEPS